MKGINNMKRIYLDLHVLQTVPPSCINRDDTGSPKTAIYGGTRRARVSSQAWKKAIRDMFCNTLDSSLLGQRTLKVLDMVAGRIAAIDSSLDGTALAKKALEAAGIAFSKKKEDDAAALFFMGAAQADAIAKIAADESFAPTSTETKKALKEALNSNCSADIALFGRMVANDPTLNVDACAQVAHSISTHAVRNEFDYFTAVDDLSPEDSSGAGHLGTVEYNSSTLYRYATVNVLDLFKYLGDDTAEVVRSFTEAFVRSMPTGKQNTFANRTLPDTVYVTLRADQPINLVGAFECPMKEGAGYVEQSQKRLADHAEQVYKNFAGEPIAAWAVGGGMDEIAKVMPLNELLECVKEAVAEQLAEGSTGI